MTGQTYPELATWLWSMIKTWTPCPYAAADTALWFYSSSGSCIAIEAGTTTQRPCSNVYPVICLFGKQSTRTFTRLTPTAVAASTVTIVTVTTTTATFTFNLDLTAISSVFITVPLNTATTTTETRIRVESVDVTETRTLTGYALTTDYFTVSDTILTRTQLSTSYVLTRTVTVPITQTDLIRTTVTVSSLITVDSCPVTVTRVETISSTRLLLVTSVQFEYETVTRLETTCAPVDDSAVSSWCGCVE